MKRLKGAFFDLVWCFDGAMLADEHFDELFPSLKLCSSLSIFVRAAHCSRKHNSSVGCGVTFIKKEKKKEMRISA